jgi:hypothetical protein
LPSGVAVEKLDLSKLVEETLRYEALQTTFLIFLDIFYPSNCCCFEKNGVFQQPQAVTLRILVPGILSVMAIYQQRTQQRG